MMCEHVTVWTEQLCCNHLSAGWTADVCTVAHCKRRLASTLRAAATMSGHIGSCCSSQRFQGCDSCSVPSEAFSAASALQPATHLPGHNLSRRFTPMVVKLDKATQKLPDYKINSDRVLECRVAFPHTRHRVHTNATPRGCSGSRQSQPTSQAIRGSQLVNCSVAAVACCMLLSGPAMALDWKRDTMQGSSYVPAVMAAAPQLSELFGSQAQDSFNDPVDPFTLYGTVLCAAAPLAPLIDTCPLKPAWYMIPLHSSVLKVCPQSNQL